MSHYFTLEVKSRVLGAIFHFEGHKWVGVIYVKQKSVDGIFATRRYVTCEGGYLTLAPAMMHDGTQEGFEKVCRKWIRQRIKLKRTYIREWQPCLTLN